MQKAEKLIKNKSLVTRLFNFKESDSFLDTG